MRKTFGLAGIVLVAVICVHGYPAASHAGMLSSGDIFELRPLRVRQSVDDDFVAPGWFRFLGNFLSAAPRQTDLRLTTEDQLTIVIPALNESHVIAHYAIISAMSVVGNEFIFDVDDVMTTGEGAAPFAIYSARELVTPIGRLSPGTYTVTVRTSRFRPVNYDPNGPAYFGPNDPQGTMQTTFEVFAVPEPTTAIMMLVGLAGVVGARRYARSHSVKGRRGLVRGVSPPTSRRPGSARARR